MRFDRRFTIILAASLLWAFLVTALFRRLSGGPARAAAAEKALVVAARALPMGTILTRDALEMRSVPERLFPAGGFSRVEEVLDRPVVNGIQPQEPVVEARLAARGSGVGLAPLIPSGMRAIAVRVNDVVGVAGFILPGMRVDVLITGRPSNASESATSTILQNIAVLSAGQAIQAEGKSAISAPVVTLLVTPAEAEALTLASSDGHIQLVLRNSADAAVSPTRGRQWNELYAVHAADTSPAPAPDLRPATRPRPARPAVAAPPVATTPAPAAVPGAAAPHADSVVVIRGSVKTVEPAAKGASK